MYTGFAHSARRAVYATGAVTAAIGGVVGKTAEYGDNVAKTARKLNLTVQGLQELRHAADLSGIAQGKFDNSMLKFQKRLGETVAGIGYAKDIYKDLGIQIKDSNGIIRPTEALFSDVSDALIGMQDKTKRTRYAMELFGRQGAGMVLMMKDGSAGIKSMREEARKLGGVMDSEAAKKSEEFIDTLARTKQVAGGVVRELGINLMPMVSDMFKMLSRQIHIYRPQITRFFKDLSVSIPRMIGRVIEFFKNMRKRLAPIFSWIGKMINSIGWEKSALLGMALFIGGPFLVSLSNLIPLFSGVTTAIRAAIPLVKTFWVALAGGPVGWVIAGIAALVAAVIIFRKQLMPVVTIIRDTLTPVMKEFRSLFDETRTAVTGLIDSVGAAGLTPVFEWYGRTLVKVLGFMARIHVSMATLPIRGMIAGVRAGIAIWTKFFKLLKTISDFAQKTLKPVFSRIKEWMRPGLDTLNEMLKKIEPVISGVKKLARTLGVGAPDAKTIAHQDKDLGVGTGNRRAGLSGRQLTDQISRIGNPRYGQSVADKVEAQGGVGGATVQQLLSLSAENDSKPQKNKIEVDFRNMPRGTEYKVSGDSDIDVDAGFAFGEY